MGSTTTAASEKTAQELRKEIAELRQQQREISDRLRDPRGLRRGGDLSGNGPRPFGGVNGIASRLSGTIRQADRFDAGDDQPPPKRRLSSAVVKVKDGEVIQDTQDGVEDTRQKDSITEGDGTTTMSESDKRSRFLSQHRGDFNRRDGNRRTNRMDFEPPTEYVPRVLPKNDDPNLVNRNRRILGNLLGTLEKFQKEDKHLSASEAYMRRSDSLQRAEQRAREESERLRQQEREKIAENRRRDLTLRARVIAKAEEKKLELLFLEWSEHQKRLSNFLRTKAEPPIYWLPGKPVDEDATVIEQRREQAFLEWKTARREELSKYQKELQEQIVANAETRWQNNRNARRDSGTNVANLQETMDKELETHQLEHGPKTRKIPGGAGSNDDDEDLEEDVNVVEDDILDEMLDADDNRRIDEVAKPEESNGATVPDDIL